MKAAQTKADEAYQKLAPGLLQKGADFAEIAQRYSEDPESAVKGGEYPGWIGESEDLMTEIQLHPLHGKILTLQLDEISRPFQVDDSLYIVQVLERTEPEKLAFEKAKPYIQEMLTQQKHNELLSQLSQKLFQQNNLVLFEGVLQNYFKNLGSATIQPGTASGN
jgi:parvulin-like peptidyl-prolyl isomerase